VARYQKASNKTEISLFVYGGIDLSMSQSPFQGQWQLETFTEIKITITQASI
jgi:hypothetical protein